MVINSIRNSYIYKVNKIDSNINKDKNTHESRWLCVHCMSGVVYRLPARCLECERLVNEEIIKK